MPGRNANLRDETISVRPDSGLLEIIFCVGQLATKARDRGIHTGNVDAVGQSRAFLIGLAPTMVCLDVSRLRE